MRFCVLSLAPKTKQNYKARLPASSEEVGPATLGGPGFLPIMCLVPGSIWCCFPGPTSLLRTRTCHTTLYSSPSCKCLTGPASKRVLTKMKATAETVVHGRLPFMSAILSRRSLRRGKAAGISAERSSVALHCVLGNHKDSKSHLR